MVRIRELHVLADTGLHFNFFFSFDGPKKNVSFYREDMDSALSATVSSGELWYICDHARGLHDHLRVWRSAAVP